MAYGYAPKLTLEITSEDGAYGLLKTPAEVARQNLKMLVLTSPGERVMVPDFGVGIKRYLFELTSVGLEQTIRQRIIDQVAKYLPYIALNSVSVLTSQTTPEVPDNTLAVRISYRSPGGSQTLEVKVS